MNKTMILIPRISEKAYGMSLARNTYVFQVPTDASKQSIGFAVAAQFDVTVTNVRVLTLKGKKKRTFSKGGKFVAGERSDIKKAYVTLKAGDSIAIFAAEDAEEKKPAKAKKEKK